MKKFLLFLLSAMMLFTACGTPNSVDESSSESSEASLEEEYDGPRRYTLVSKDKPYTVSAGISDAYPDLYNQQMTDGQKTPNIGAHYVDSRMVGFTSGCTVQIDLGDDGKRICALVARSLVMNQDGVKIAATAKFSGSADGETFKTLGTVIFEDTGDKTVSEARLELEEVADYRYIRVLITKGTGYFFFTDEVEVYADVAPKQSTDYAALAYAEENIDRQAWKAVSTGVAADPVETKILSRGAKYAIADCDFDERALDNEERTKLTDGTRTNQYFSEDVWVGLKPREGKDASITLALNDESDRIHSIKVHALGGGVGVEYPAYIDVYAASGTENIFLGRMYGPAEGDNFAYNLMLPEYIKARTLRFIFPSGTGNYWIEEIEVISGYNEETVSELYPPLDLPEVTEELLWDETEADYNEVKNLLLGRTQQVSPLFYSKDETRADQSPASFPYLTDGKRASDTYCYSGEWFFTGGDAGLEFFYDLEKLSSVSSVNVSVLEQTDWGISRPKFISVFLSEDGENWYEMDEYDRVEAENNGEVLSAAAKRLDISFDFGAPYAARFVRIRLEGAAMFFDELEAFGTKAVTSETIRLADSGIKATPFAVNAESEAFATTENTPVKAKHIPIVYGNDMTAESLLPFVAYIDEDGNVKDTLMDGFLYCMSGALPSGSRPHLDNYKQDWEYMYDICFNGDAGFDALESTVQTVKDALDIPDYTVQVYITILTVRDSVTDFGDVDGDGVTEDLSTADGRKKVVDWYLDMCMTEFEARGYKNLELGGFYWINEAVTWEKDDSDIITEVAQYVHDKGSYFLWIPYYTAYRFYTGYELGFDLVSMQPNVVFTTDAPLWRFDSAVELTKARKMAIEIEHSYQALGDPDFARSYMLYLYNGVESGYIDAVNIYYDDIDNFALMANSDDPLCRLQYDATYDYVKGVLDVTPDTRDTVSVSGGMDSIISGNLKNDGEIAMFTLLTPPEHGYVAFATDGSFRYFPDKGYTGTDSFTYTYNRLLGESEPCTVEITVG